MDGWRYEISLRVSTVNESDIDIESNTIIFMNIVLNNKVSDDFLKISSGPFHKDFPNVVWRSRECFRTINFICENFQTSENWGSLLKTSEGDSNMFWLYTNKFWYSKRVKNGIKHEVIDINTYKIIIVLCVFNHCISQAWKSLKNATVDIINWFLLRTADKFLSFFHCFSLAKVGKAGSQT